MDLADHLNHLAAEGPRLSAAVRASGVDAPVPTCPDWTVRDLLAHIGEVHRWAAATVNQRAAAPPAADPAWTATPADDELADWFDAGHGALVEALRGCPPDADFWAFLPAPSATRFWARRQAHETCIHRIDAEAAAGLTSTVDPALGLDGLDELLLGFFSRGRGRLVADPPVTLGIRATDADVAWHIRISPDGRQVTREQQDADCTVAASAADLYVGLWNRRALTDLDVTGDPTVLDLWRERATISWG